MIEEEAYNMINRVVDSRIRPKVSWYNITLRLRGVWSHFTCNKKSEHQKLLHRHLRYQNLAKHFKLAVCMNWMQLWTLGLSKLSVIFFYRSIFVGRPFRILSIVMIIIVTLWVLGGFFAVAFQCGTRITLLWASAKTTGVYCTSGKKVAFGFSIPDVIIDFMILCMPIYWVSSSQSSSAVLCFGEHYLISWDSQITHVGQEETCCLWGVLVWSNVSLSK